MSASISRYLKDFSLPKVDLSLVPPKYFPDLDDDFGSQARIEMKAPVPQVDIEAERRQAAREAAVEARSQALEESNSGHARDIARLQAEHAAEMEAMRIRCDEEIAAMIVDRFSDMGSQLAVLLGDQTARVLAPVMDDVLAQKAVQDLARVVTHSITAGEACKITVKGPLRLFEALKRHLTDETLIFRHQETTELDLSVEFGDSILVTRMAAWSDTVRKVLA